MYGLAGKLLTRFGQGARRLVPQPRFAPSSLIDTATNPKTYQGLAQSASDTLGRALPPQFRGVGFQNVPPSALSALDDAAAAPFAGPVRQQILDKASKEFTRKAGSGTTRVPVIPTGGQPVPTVTPTSGTNPIVGPIPSRLSPGGGIIPQPGGNLLKNLGGLNPLNNPKRLLDPTGFRGGLIYGTAANTVLPRLGFDEKNTAAISTALTMPGGPIPKFLAGMVAYDVNNPLAKGTLDSISENLSPEQQALRDKLLKERIAAGSQKATVGNSGLMNMPPSVNTNLSAYDEGVTLPDVGSAGNAGGYDPGLGRIISAQDVEPKVVDTSTQLPPSAEQTYMDPYAYQLQVYGQGRQAAQSQAEMDKVRNLGLAIHRDMYANTMYKSHSPQIRETFPDMSTNSLENIVKEKGVQLPGSMTNVDSYNELLAQDEEARIYKLDETTADVEEILKEIAERRKGK